MPIETWLLFTATVIAASLTPGPAVLLVASAGLADGVAASVRAAAGIVAANGVYIALSVAGLAAILAASPTLFVALKWVGAAYLVWVGARMVFRRPRGPVGPVEGHGRRAGGGPFLRSMVCELTNPKAMIFYGAIFPSSSRRRATCSCRR
jgi:homoserine/homoserine lactone efflux protein